MRHWKFIIPVTLVCALMGLLAVKTTGADQKRPDPVNLIGAQAPNIVLPSLPDTSQTMGLQMLKGKVILLNFWASWCTTCAAEHPQLLKIAQSGAPVSLVGIAYMDTPADSVAFLQKYGNPFVLSGADVNGITGVEYSVRATPESYIIDKSGRVRKKIIGEITAAMWQDELLPFVNALAAE